MAKTEIVRDQTYETLTVVIATDADLTEAYAAKGRCLFGLVVPSTFDGTAILFHVSADGTTYQPLYDTTNTAVGMTIAANRSYDLPTELASWPYWKIETVTDQSTTNTVFVVVSKG